MFVDFNKVFNNKPQTEIGVPKALIEHLSSKLPKGLKYKADNSGNCIIVSDQNSITMGGFVLKPTEEQKEILGKRYTNDEILQYSYNAQDPIPLGFEKDGIVILNGEEMPLEKIFYNPFNPIHYVSGSASIIPRPFPKPFSVIVGCDKYSTELSVSRIPNKSVHIASYESEKNKPLQIQYNINESKQEISFNISFNLSYAKTIRDIVESTTIYNAFAEGKGEINGTPLFTGINSNSSKKYDYDSIAFWEKVLQIEEILDVTFIPMKDGVDYGTMCTIETLYQNLIKKRPVRIDKKIESLDGVWDKKIEEKIKESRGSVLLFEYQTTSHIALFGINIKLPCLVEIFNSRFLECSVKGNKFKIVLGHETEEKKMYVAEQRFLSEDEIKNFTSKLINDRIKEFHEAKTVQYYLDN